ncbi:coagulation factor V-like, partial [Actinia tenebrosa]|uniref:Coagulation factor V-like n=1 Tax=Actinia tenebrosa TaxID=6105 RepID=A0A6P8GY67_ACTTE
CESPLGMEDGRILDSQITASTSQQYFPPKNARLKRGAGLPHYCWGPAATRHLFAQVFPGNTDRNTVVTHTIEVPFKARYIRITVLGYSGYPALRAEVYGCPVQ